MSTRASTRAGYDVVDGDVDGWASVTLVSGTGGLRATFVPELAMLGTSLMLESDELLGQRSGVRAYVEHASTMGIPLLHPWANRLDPPRVGDSRHRVDTSSRLVHCDDYGLPIHGLHLVDFSWERTACFADDRGAYLEACLRFDDPALVAEFPYPHEILVNVSLVESTLTIDTQVRADCDRSVPLAFGWHPYFRLPRDARPDWIVGLPATRKALLDGRMLPTGAIEEIHPEIARLGHRTFDDLYTGLGSGVFTLEGEHTRIEVAFGEGYSWAQVFAPANDDVVAFEPMVAPTNALATGVGLQIVENGQTFSAIYSITATKP